VARLGEILLARGALETGRLAEALESQVIYGARLGTNLLEVGAVTEEALAQALGEQHGCSALWGDFAVEPRALALLSAERADRFDAVPLRIEGRHLSVLVADPRKLQNLDDLAFATGKAIRPVLVVESRLWENLQRHYGLIRPLRGVQALSARGRPPIATGAVEAPRADLMDEEAFAALYDPTGTVTPVPARPPPAQADAFRGALVSTEQVMAALQEQASRLAPPGADRALRITPSAGLEPPPLSFDEAVAALAGVADRDAIARIVLRCARSRLRRAVLLTVRGRHADGWEGLGEGITPQVVGRLRVPLDQPGILQTVVAGRAHFLGPLQKTPANVGLLRALGGGAPRNSFALPVLARGQVVNLLYADDGRGRLLDPAGVGELLILATHISRSYEVLLSRAR